MSPLCLSQGDGSRGRGGSLSLSASSSSVTDHSTELPTNCGSPFKAHSGDVNAIAYAPTGAAFATAGRSFATHILSPPFSVYS